MIKYGVSNYQGTAKLKIAAPIRHALLPPPAPLPEAVKAEGGLEVTWPLVM